MQVVLCLCFQSLSFLSQGWQGGDAVPSLRGGSSLSFIPPGIPPWPNTLAVSIPCLWYKHSMSQTWPVWLVLETICKQNSTWHVPAPASSHVWLMKLCRSQSGQSRMSLIHLLRHSSFPAPVTAVFVLVSHHCFLPDMGTILLPGAKELESFGGAAPRPAVQVTMKKPTNTFPRSSQAGAKERGAAALPSYSPESPGLGTRAAATGFGQKNSKSQAEDFHGAYENSPQSSPLR